MCIQLFINPNVASIDIEMTSTTEWHSDEDQMFKNDLDEVYKEILDYPCISHDCMCCVFCWYRYCRRFDKSFILNLGFNHNTIMFELENKRMGYSAVYDRKLSNMIVDGFYLIRNTTSSARIKTIIFVIREKKIGKSFSVSKLETINEVKE